jgi:hypothetical protein
VKVVLSGAPSVVFESRDASLRTAIDAALAGAERGVRSSLKRRRMKPMKAAARRRFKASLRDSQEELEHVSQMVSTTPHGGAEPEQHRA